MRGPANLEAQERGQLLANILVAAPPSLIFILYYAASYTLFSNAFSTGGPLFAYLK
jgi:hypothetical protein